MTDSFLPFQQLIDPGRALRILRDATDGADDGELFLERTRSESLVFDDRRLRNAGYGAAQGFGLHGAHNFGVLADDAFQGSYHFFQVFLAGFVAEQAVALGIGRFVLPHHFFALLNERR